MPDQTTGWQPIETAPRDGRHFLAAAVGGEVILAHWMIYEVSRGKSVGGVVDSSSGDSAFGYEVPDVAPTHWMPLPEPPDA